MVTYPEENGQDDLTINFPTEVTATYLTTWGPTEITTGHSEILGQIGRVVVYRLHVDESLLPFTFKVAPSNYTVSNPLYGNSYVTITIT